MSNINYANAYKEVLVVIKNLVKEDYEKIPKDYIEFLSANCNRDYEFRYDSTKSLDEQQLLDESRYILFGLFEKFGATEEQRHKIDAFKNNYYIKQEEERRKKYNPDDIFKNTKQTEDTSANIPIANTSIVEYKESFFKKFINKIKSIFHIK